MEEPCIFLFRTMLHSVATHLHHFSMVLFSVLCFFFVDAPIEQTRLYRENSLRDIVLGWRPCGRNLCSVTDPCGML